MNVTKLLITILPIPHASTEKKCPTMKFGFILNAKK